MGGADCASVDERVSVNLVFYEFIDSLSCFDVVVGVDECGCVVCDFCEGSAGCCYYWAAGCHGFDDGVAEAFDAGGEQVSECVSVQVAEFDISYVAQESHVVSYSAIVGDLHNGGDFVF